MLFCFCTVLRKQYAVSQQVLYFKYLLVELIWHTSIFVLDVYASVLMMHDVLLNQYDMA